MRIRMFLKGKLTVLSHDRHLHGLFQGGALFGVLGQFCDWHVEVNVWNKYVEISWDVMDLYHHHPEPLQPPHPPDLCAGTTRQKQSSVITQKRGSKTWKRPMVSPGKNVDPEVRNWFFHGPTWNGRVKKRSENVVSTDPVVWPCSFFHLSSV